MNPRTRIIAVFAVLIVVAAATAYLALGGLPSTSGAKPRAEVLTPFPPEPPAKWDLTTPEKAVTSYLSWITYSYRMLNSDASTATMEPTETVRVDSYIELNRQQGKGIDQTLKSIRFVKTAPGEDGFTEVSTTEEWEYAYFSKEEPTRAVSPLYRATYDVVYRLKQGKDGLWRVDRVTATPKGEVK